MKKLVLIIPFILFISHLSAQIYDPVKWDFSYEKKGDKQYELVFTATIDKNSHIYAMDIPAGGPIPTSFRFDTIPAYTLSGNTSEVTKPVEVLDDAFGFKIKTFSNKAEFRQKITSVESSFTVKGAVNFMACNNATCSPPKDVEFAIKIEDKSRISNILGFIKEKREFSPHLTVGRVRTAKNKEKLLHTIQTYADTLFGDFFVDSITLKKSDLSAKGPMYTTIKKAIFPTR